MFRCGSSGPASAGAAREPDGAEHVGRLVDHRDHQRVGGHGAVAAGGGAERVQRLGRLAGRAEAVGLCGGDPRGQDAAALSLVGMVEVGFVAPHRGVDRVGVEADVQPREVEAEGAHLAQQILDGAVGDRAAAGGVAHELDVAPELAGVAIGERAVRLLAAHPQALGDVVELGAHRLATATFAEPARDLRHQRRVAPQAALERCAAGAHLLRALRRARGKPLDAVDHQPHRHAAVEVDRGGEGGGGDAGVAVHVTARPAAEPDGSEVERLGAEAALELAHELGHGVEQHVVEEVQVAAHLVVDLRPRAPHLGGLPPQRQRLADAVDHPLFGGRSEPVVVELREPLADIAGVLHHRPAGRLGRVRGECEVEPQVVERAGGGLGGAGRRAAGRPRPATRAAAAPRRARSRAGGARARGSRPGWPGAAPSSTRG